MGLKQTQMGRKPRISEGKLGNEFVVWMAYGWYDLFSESRRANALLLFLLIHGPAHTLYTFIPYALQNLFVERVLLSTSNHGP